jgi:hypothetical protein
MVDSCILLDKLEHTILIRARLIGLNPIYQTVNNMLTSKASLLQQK